MIGEKIGYFDVRPRTYDDGTSSRTLFDYADASKKLDVNQSYSQALIAIAAYKGIRPSEVNMDAYGWLRKGLERENRELKSIGSDGLDILNMMPRK